jgi:hypothetical protein
MFQRLVLKSQYVRFICTIIGIHFGIIITFRVLGLPRTQRMLRVWAEIFRKKSVIEPRIRVTRIRRAFNFAQSRLLLRGTCLTRSLTLWAVLLQYQIETEICIGMRKAGERIEGHAWLEYEGTSINEAPGVVATYTRLDAQAAAFERWC